MTPYIIAIFSLVIYPIIAWLVFKLTEKRPLLRKRLVLIILW